MDEPQGTVSVSGVEFDAAPTRKRGRETVRDMVLSLGVVGLALAGLLLLAWRPSPASDPVREVDWASIAASARAGAAFPLAVPSPAPAGWRATSARYEPWRGGGQAWHIGFVTAGGSYAGLEQSNAEPASFVRETVAGGRPEGVVAIGGLPWQRYGPGPNGYRSLVRPGQPTTLIVTGSASEPELEQLARSLR